MEDVTNKSDTEKSIPSHLVFNDNKMYPPGGFKKSIIYPPNNNGPYNATNNTISFQIGGKGFLDPYSLYIKLKVVNLNSRIPLQLDNSAHSLFSKIMFRGNGTDFEIIEDYDVMMSNISDCTRSNEERKACENEGYGYSYDKCALYKTDNPLCVGNCEPILQPRGIGARDLYTMSYDRFARGLSIQTKPIIQFYEVKNGAPSVDYSELDSKTFIIPVWSFICGWGLTSANYKYIPLQVFSPLEIHFKLNENAFFVPLPASCLIGDGQTIQVTGKGMRSAVINPGEVGEFDVDRKNKDVEQIYRCNTMESENIGTYDKDNAINVGVVNGPVRKGYQVTQAQLMTEQMFFENYIHDSVLLQPTFRIVTHQYKKIRELTFNKNNIPTNIQLTELKGSVKYMHFIFLNNSYLKNCFQRKLFKYSLNLRKYWLRVGSDEFPNAQIDGNAGNSTGEENNTLFYLALKRSAYKTTIEKNMAINPYNFALNYSPLDLISSNAWISTKFSGYNEYVGRCIYAIDFERFPQTDNYWSGISMRGAMPCDLYLKPSLFENSNLNHFEKERTSFTIMIFVWMDYVLEYNRGIGKWEFKD
jgi:hypothetical protein